MKKGLHPHSLANLARGRAIAIERRRTLRLDHMSADTRKRVSAAGGRARHARQTARIRAMVASLTPLEAYRLGDRTGYNRAYLRWQAWGDRLLGRTRSHHKKAGTAA